MTFVLHTASFTGVILAANPAFKPRDLVVNVCPDTGSLTFNWYCDGTVSGTPSDIKWQIRFTNCFSFLAIYAVGRF